MKFIANLRRQTLEAFESHSVPLDGYLLSKHRITKDALKMALQVRKQDLPLFADNGTKELIDDVITHFQSTAGQLSAEVKKLRRALGRVPRGNDVPKELRSSMRIFADQVVADCMRRSQAIDSDELLVAELSMKPTDLIAKEDFATTCLLALDVEREITGWPVDRFITRNRQSLRLWQRVANDERVKGLHVYAVLSAVDYNTARSAAMLAARAGVEAAALGIASITKDLNATDFYVMGTKKFSLEKPVPRRYVRLAQVLKGMADGFRDISPLKRFHCLGLGAPALLPIAAAAFDSETMVSIDATSPIHDAAKDHVLYDPKNLGDRASTVEIVLRIVQGEQWPFISPFTIAFKDKFGHDPSKAREWWEKNHRPIITLELLEELNDLTKALPLFSEADEAIRIKALDCRIAHNHWVLGKIAQTNTGVDQRKIALQTIENWLHGPETTTTRGLRIAHRILSH